MKQDDPAREFLRRLERGEDRDNFIEELTKLQPEHRADVLEALFKKLKKVEQQREESE